MRNRLLSGLPPADLTRLQPHLVPVDLPVRGLLNPPEEAGPSLFFIESGLVSVVAVSGTEQIEVALFGREGFTGAQALLGYLDPSTRTIVQCPGSAFRVDAGELRHQMSDSPELNGAMTRFLSFSLTQVSHTALANGRHTLEQRLARWLLMAHDRLDGNDIALTHDFLSVTLGVRRPGVTVALHMLEGAHAIRSRRNSIVILDRSKLRASAGLSYGVPEETYLALFGSALSRDAAPAPDEDEGSSAETRDEIALIGS